MKSGTSVLILLFLIFSNSYADSSFTNYTNGSRIEALDITENSILTDINRVPIVNESVNNEFLTSFYASITIGVRAYAIVASILNNFHNGVTVHKVIVYDQNDNIYVQTSDSSLLHGNNIDFGETIGISISPVLPPLLSDVEQYYLKWFLNYKGLEFVVTSYFGTVNETSPSIVGINDTPIVSPIEDITVEEGNEITIVINATDGDGDFLTYGVINNPRDSYLDENVFTWMPFFDQAGVYQITFTVSDCMSTVSTTVTITVKDTGPDPDISLDTTISIGDVIVGSSGSGSFTIRNEGNGYIFILYIGTDNPCFIPNLPLANIPEIAPGDSLIVEITFSPTSPGMQNTTVTVDIFSSYGENTLFVSVSGNGIVVPDISLDTNFLSFGSVYIDSTLNKPFIIANTGTAALIIDSVSVRDSLIFSVNPCSANILPGKSQTMVVTFKPRAEKSYIDTLTVLNNDSTVTVAVNGVGVPTPFARIVVDSSSLNFGEVYIDSISRRSIVITNAGNIELILSDITTKDSTTFSVNPDFATIAPGDSQIVTVTFSPLQEQVYQDILTIANNDSLVAILLKGEGLRLPFFHSSSENIVFKPHAEFHSVWIKLNYKIANPSVSVFISEDGGETFREPVICNVDGDIFKGLIPAYQEGNTVRYYFEVLDDEGNKYYLPEGAPEQLFALKVAFSGDANQDGTTNIFDLLDILKILSGATSPDIVADVNKDGKVDIFDLLSLLQSLSAQ